MRLILDHHLGAWHCGNISILLTSLNCRQFCRDMRREEIHRSVVHPSKGHHSWVVGCTCHFEDPSWHTFWSFLGGIFNAMTPTETIFLDCAHKIKPHRSELLHHGDGRVKAIRNKQSSPLVLRTSKHARNIADDSGRTTLGVRRLAIIAMIF